MRIAIGHGRDAAAELREEKAARKATRGAPPNQTQPVTADSRPTFATCWKSFWLVTRPQLSNVRRQLQWETTMETYVLPHSGQRPIGDIRPGEFIHMLRPIWHSKEETARRVLQRVEAVFVSAITRELRTRGRSYTGASREIGTRRRSQSHHAALPYNEVAAIVQHLRWRKGPLEGRLAFEFLIKTATRSGETHGAAWTEMDVSGCSWTIPAERMKGRVEHVIPRSPYWINSISRLR